MIIMGKRTTLKFLKKFSEEELNEKRAEKVHVKQKNKKNSMSLGKFPNKRVKKTEGGKYLVVVYHRNRAKVYFFNKDGKMLGSNRFENDEKEEKLNEIENNTSTIFRIS